MPDYATSQAQLVADLVTAGMPRQTKMGTVSARSSGSLGLNGTYWAAVTMDGSSGTAQPVKCFESVIVDVGDRVGLVKYEGEWIITGNYTLRTLGEGGFESVLAGPTTSTSGTFVDVPTSPNLTMHKYRDHTFLRIDMAISMYASSVPTVVEFAAAILSEDGLTSYDAVLTRMPHNTANNHTTLYGGETTAAHPGGQNFTITARWRRVSGGGNMTVDANDYVTLRVREVVS